MALAGLLNILKPKERVPCVMTVEQVVNILLTRAISKYDIQVKPGHSHSLLLHLLSGAVTYVEEAYAYRGANLPTNVTGELDHTIKRFLDTSFVLTERS